MSGSPKIPGFKVKVVDTAKETVVHEQDFLKAPGTDFIDLACGTGNGDRLRVRRKTFEGQMLVTFRSRNARSENPRLYDLAPDRPVTVNTTARQHFRVTVELLPEDMWMVGKAINFRPPRATITRERAGWRVTFAPQQRPCVLTIALHPKTKDENLPSFPFPTNPAHTEGSYLIPAGQLGGAAAGSTVRLGVRGAGLEAMVALPAAIGEVKMIEPEHFASKGPAQPELLTEAYVAGKYQEKQGLITYR